MEPSPTPSTVDRSPPPRTQKVMIACAAVTALVAAVAVAIIFAPGLFLLSGASVSLTGTTISLSTRKNEWNCKQGDTFLPPNLLRSPAELTPFAAFLRGFESQYVPGTDSLLKELSNLLTNSSGDNLRRAVAIADTMNPRDDSVDMQLLSLGNVFKNIDSRRIQLVDTIAASIHKVERNQGERACRAFEVLEPMTQHAADLLALLAQNTSPNVSKCLKSLQFDKKNLSLDARSLVRLLNHTNIETREISSHILQQLNTKHIETLELLEKLLQGDDAWTSFYAAKALSNHKANSEKVEPLLLNLTKSIDSSLSAASISLLINIYEENTPLAGAHLELANKLLDHLNEDSPEVILAALAAVDKYRIESESIYESLITIIHNPNKQVRLAAIKLLSKFESQTEHTVELIIQALDQAIASLPETEQRGTALWQKIRKQKLNDSDNTLEDWFGFLSKIDPLNERLREYLPYMELGYYGMLGSGNKNHWVDSLFEKFPICNDQHLANLEYFFEHPTAQITSYYLALRLILGCALSSKSMQAELAKAVLTDEESVFSRFKKYTKNGNPAIQTAYSYQLENEDELEHFVNLFSKETDTNSQATFIAPTLLGETDIKSDRAIADICKALENTKRSGTQHVFDSTTNPSSRAINVASESLNNILNRRKKGGWWNTRALFVQAPPLADLVFKGDPKHHLTTKAISSILYELLKLNNKFDAHYIDIANLIRCFKYAEQIPNRVFDELEYFFLSDPSVKAMPNLSDASKTVKALAEVKPNGERFARFISKLPSTPNLAESKLGNADLLLPLIKSYSLEDILTWHDRGWVSCDDTAELLSIRVRPVDSKETNKKYSESDFTAIIRSGYLYISYGKGTEVSKIEITQKNRQLVSLIATTALHTGPQPSFEIDLLVLLYEILKKFSPKILLGLS